MLSQILTGLMLCPGLDCFDLIALELESVLDQLLSLSFERLPFFVHYSL